MTDHNAHRYIYLIEIDWSGPDYEPNLLLDRVVDSLDDLNDYLNDYVEECSEERTRHSITRVDLGALDWKYATAINGVLGEFK